VTLRDDIAGMLRGPRTNRPSEATEEDVTAADLHNLQAAVTELQQAVVRLAEEIEKRS
jgi:hypothetical protein